LMRLALVYESSIDT